MVEELEQQHRQLFQLKTANQLLMQENQQLKAAASHDVTAAADQLTSQDTSQMTSNVLRRNLSLEKEVETLRKRNSHLQSSLDKLTSLNRDDNDVIRVLREHVDRLRTERDRLEEQLRSINRDVMESGASNVEDQLRACALERDRLETELLREKLTVERQMRDLHRHERRTLAHKLPRARAIDVRAQKRDDVAAVASKNDVTSAGRQVRWNCGCLVDAETLRVEAQCEYHVAVERLRMQMRREDKENRRPTSSSSRRTHLKQPSHA